jgi:hypothetical protein
VEDLRLFNNSKQSLLDSYQSSLSSYPLLSSYANVISSMFLALKKLSKLTGELTLSWSSFLSLVDAILEKTFKELTAKLQAEAEREKTQKSSTTIVIDEKGRLAVRSMK